MGSRLTLHKSRDASPEWSEKKALDELTREYNRMTEVYAQGEPKVQKFDDSILKGNGLQLAYSCITIND